MINRRRHPRIRNQGWTQIGALAVLLMMGGLAIAGPSGLMAWSDNLRQLDQRQKELAQVKQEREELRNRVALLDPKNTDPDLAGQLLRSDLNVAHQDEMVMLLK